MEPTETTAPVIPIAQPEPSPPSGDSASDIMGRFAAMKAEATPAPQTTPEATPKPDAEPAPTAVEPLAPTGTEQPTKERMKWGELKAKATKTDELEKTLAQKEQELNEFRQKNEALSKVDPTRYEQQIAEKEKAIAEYEKKIAVFDVRESKQFRAEVLEPMTKVATDMDRLAATYKVSAADLKAALTIADPAEQLARINELTGDMSELHKNKVWGAVEKTQEIYEKAARIEENASEARKEMEFLQHQETQKQKEERQRQLTAAAESVKKQMLEHLPMLKDEAVANDVFSADVSPADPVMQAYNAMSGKAMVHLVKDLRTKDARIAELEKELATRSAVGVKAGGGTSATPAPAEAPANGYEGGTLWERAKSAAAAGHIQLVGSHR